MGLSQRRAAAVVQELTAKHGDSRGASEAGRARARWRRSRQTRPKTAARRTGAWSWSSSSTIATHRVGPLGTCDARASNGYSSAFSFVFGFRRSWARTRPRRFGFRFARLTSPSMAAEVLVAGATHQTDASGSLTLTVIAGQRRTDRGQGRLRTATATVQVAAGAQQDVVVDLQPEATVEEKRHRRREHAHRQAARMISRCGSRSCPARRCRRS